MRTHISAYLDSEVYIDGLHIHRAGAIGTDGACQDKHGVMIVPCLECHLLLEFQGFRAVRVTLVCRLLRLHPGGQGAQENLYQEPLHACLHVCRAERTCLPE